MRLAIFGTGGVGGYFGGRLAQAGQDVVFIARGAHLDAIRREGLQIESIAGDFTVRPADATDSPAAVGHVDAVLVGVRAWQVSDAAGAMGPMLGPKTIVVPLTNGVEAADQLAAVIGAERVVGGLCRILSYVAGPGRIRHAGVDPQIEIGERDRSKSERVASLCSAFDGAVGVKIVVPTDIEVALWEKFLFIAPLSGVGAVARAPVGSFRHVPKMRTMLEGAMQEVFGLARARGVTLPANAVELTLAYVDGLPDGTTASMQRDIMDGRPSELENQTGAIVRLAQTAGIPAPVNEHIYRELLTSEQRARAGNDIP